MAEILTPKLDSTAFKRILVTINHSLLSEEVFAQALEMAAILPSKLLICHCLEMESSEVFEEITSTKTRGLYSPEELWEIQEESLTLAESIQDAQDYLEIFAQKAAQKEVTTELHCLIGNAGEEICNLAEEENVDLIVIGRRGLKGFSEMFLGSISNYVFHHAPCSVLVVQHPDD